MERFAEVTDELLEHEILSRARALNEALQEAASRGLRVDSQVSLLHEPESTYSINLRVAHSPMTATRRWTEREGVV